MAESDADICMVYDERGNALHCFDYTPEALDEEALKLRRSLGEVTTVTYGPSPFVMNNSSVERRWRYV